MSRDVLMFFILWQSNPHTKCARNNNIASIFQTLQTMNIDVKKQFYLNVKIRPAPFRLWHLGGDKWLSKRVTGRFYTS